MTTYRPRTRPAAPIPPVAAPGPKPNSWEWLADEAAAWITTTADAVITGVLESDRAPFSAPASQNELAAYYSDRLYFPNGLPNPETWQAEFKRVGAGGLVEAVQGAIAWRKREGLPVLELPPLGPPEAPTDMDVREAVDAQVTTMPVPAGPQE